MDVEAGVMSRDKFPADSEDEFEEGRSRGVLLVDDLERSALGIAFFVPVCLYVLPIKAPSRGIAGVKAPLSLDPGGLGGRP